MYDAAWYNGLSSTQSVFALSPKQIYLLLSSIADISIADAWDGDTSGLDLDGIEGDLQYQLQVQASELEADMAYIGEIRMRTHAVIDPKWIQCDGNELSRTVYSDLFSEIGTIFGAGDGSTTFNIPDFRGRVPMSQGTGVGLSERVTGDMIGSETHQLTVAEMPVHDHVLNQSNSGTSGNDNTQRGNNGAPLFAGSNPIENSGGDEPHNNIQPSICLHFVIKVLP